ncbi:MAG TPA: hypothetical protein VGK52_03470 [Polyangia bacterium]
MNAHAQGDKVTRARQERQEGLREELSDSAKARSSAEGAREGGGRQGGEEIVPQVGQKGLDEEAFREEGRHDEGRREEGFGEAHDEAVGGANCAGGSAGDRR